MKIVSVGESTIDRYVHQNQSFVGGISLNFAVHARMLGADTVSLISRVGDDEYSHRILRCLKEHGVGTLHIKRLIGNTATCEIAVDDQGERSYPPGGYDRGVLKGFSLSANEMDYIRQQDVVVTMFDNSAPFDFIELIIDAKTDVKRVMDFGDWKDYEQGAHDIIRYLDKLDISFISGNDASVRTLAPISHHIAGLIVVTKGSGGSVAIHKGKLISQPALSVTRLIDTTGCGDAFQAAFTVSYLTDGEISRALYDGALQSSRVLSHLGAFEQ